MDFEKLLEITEKTEVDEDRERFLERIKDFPEEEQMLVDAAYDLSKESHRPQRRDSGERYFEHTRETALIIMDECQVRDPDLIISMLLHDAIEDSATFGNRLLAYSIWEKTAKFRLGRFFNKRVANIVVSLTKPKEDGEEIENIEKANEFYLNNLEKAGPDSILLKMADRLHNLRSLSSTTPEKQQRIVKETKEKYWHIFQEVLDKYPKEGSYLLDQMNTEMAKYDKIKS